MAPIHIEMIAVPPPYYAAQIKVGRYPLGPEISAPLRTLLAMLLRTASAGGLSSGTFLQNEYIKNGRDSFDAHISEWAPESGLGVWPDRPPPELWKISDIFRMARGERVPLTYRVYRLTKGPRADSQAFDMLLGSGMVMTIVHKGSVNELLERYKDIYLPAIKQPNLRILPFYVPLLDLKSLQSSHADDLSKWLGGAQFYLRESPQDNAVVVVTDSDLNALFERAGAKRDGSQNWLFQ